MQTGKSLHLTDQQAWKKAIAVIIPTLAFVWILPTIWPTLGQAQFNVQTVLAMAVGTGASAIIIHQLKGSFIIEGIVGAVLTFGFTAVLYTIMSQPIESLLGVLVVGNFLSLMVIKKLMPKQAP